MKNYTISNDFIYSVKSALNRFFINPDKVYEMYDIVSETFSKYFGKYPLIRDIDYTERSIKIKIDNLFLNEAGEIRVDGHKYNIVLQDIERAHNESINNFLNKNKDDMYHLLRETHDKQYADLFMETIPVVASMITVMWGHPSFDKAGLVVNMRLY